MKLARRHTHGSTLQRVLRGELSIAQARGELLARATSKERKGRWITQAIANIQTSKMWQRLERLENVSKIHE